ncbi:MAG: hypothetical protein V1790_19555 [Planctomycetota bacterium]
MSPGLPSEPPAAERVCRSPFAGPFAAFALACILLGGHLHTRLYTSEIQPWDAKHYYEMAQSVALTPAPAPFAHRWLPHKLVPLVAFSAKRTYEAITWATLFATALFLYSLIVRTGLNPTGAILVVIFGFLWAQWGGRFYVWYRAASEPLGYVFLVTGFCLAHQGRLATLSALTAVAVMCREQTLLVIPYYYLLSYGMHVNGRALLRCAVALVPCVIILALVRIVTPTTNEYSAFEVMRHQLATKLGSVHGVWSVFVCIVTHGGLLVPLLTMFPRRTVHRLRRHPEISVYILVNLAIGVAAGSDTDRLMYYAFPAELLLLSHVLRDAGVSTRSSWLPFLLVAIVGQVAISGTFAQESRAANVFVWWNTISCALWSSLLVFTRLAVRASAQCDEPGAAAHG